MKLYSSDNDCTFELIFGDLVTYYYRLDTDICTYVKKLFPKIAKLH